MKKPKKLYPAKRYLPLESAANLVATSGPDMVPSERNVFASKAIIPGRVSTEAYATTSSGLQAIAVGYGPVAKEPNERKSELLNFAMS